MKPEFKINYNPHLFQAIIKKYREGKYSSIEDEEFKRDEKKRIEELEEEYKEAQEKLKKTGAYRHTCVICRDDFFTKSYFARYCSYRCRNKSTIMGQEKRRRKRLSREVSCKQCGKNMPKKRENREYCSKGCKQKSYRKRQSQTKPE